MELLYKKEELRTIIKDSLHPHIDNDYIFIDLPYYKNIGDVLIWNGTEEFLTGISYKCRYRSSFYSFDNRILDRSIIIIMQGGGNWGDIWHEHNDFRKKIVQLYPNNRIIILPQTIYYKREENLLSDFSLFAEHKHLVICARDRYTFEMLNKHLTTSKNLLLPDMAFFLNIQPVPGSTRKSLFFKRIDKELNESISYNCVPIESDIHDWPTYEGLIKFDKWFDRVEFLMKKIFPSFKFCNLHKTNDVIYQKYLRYVYMKEGVKLLSQYDTIYSTRLHAAILGVLLGKRIVLFDNSYGKNKNFYNTWLKDLDSITLSSE